MMTTITLNQAIAAKACRDGLERFRKAHPTITLNQPFTIGDVARVNLDDALWCLRLVSPRDRVAAIMPMVKRAAKHTDDQRVHGCIAALDRWLAGDDSVDLKAAREAARAARAEAAEAAARAARAEAAEAAAWAAEAAEAAAWAAAEAAEAAAWAAAEAAEAAAEAAEAARTAAAEREAQRDDLVAYFGEML